MTIMQFIRKNKVPIVLIIFSLVLVLSGIVFRNHLPIYFPNEEKKTVALLSKDLGNSELYLKIDDKKKDYFEIKVYDASGDLIKPSESFSSDISSGNTSPGKGYYYYYGKLGEGKAIIYYKNKTDKVIFLNPVEAFLKGDGWLYL